MTLHCTFAEDSEIYDLHGHRGSQQEFWNVKAWIQTGFSANRPVTPGKLLKHSVPRFPTL
jgi:hypothetical protein